MALSLISFQSLTSAQCVGCWGVTQANISPVHSKCSWRGLVLRKRLVFCLFILTALCRKLLISLIRYWPLYATMHLIMTQWSMKSNLRDSEVQHAVSSASRIFLTWLSRYVGSRCALFHYSPHTKAILSQFVYESKPTSTDQADQDSNDGDNYFPDNSNVKGCNDDDAASDTLDQDKDVILAAEAAQQEDLDNAEELAELVIMVTGDEWKVASTALSKVSLVSIVTVVSSNCAVQLMKLAHKINNSPGLVEELEVLCNAAKIKPINTHWNEKSHMVVHAIHLKPVIDWRYLQQEVSCSVQHTTAKAEPRRMGHTGTTVTTPGCMYQIKFVLCISLNLLCRPSMIYHSRCRVPAPHWYPQLSHTSMTLYVPSTNSRTVSRTTQQSMWRPCEA